MNKFIHNQFPDFVSDCINRLYKRYLFWEKEYQKEADAHEKTKKELTELKKKLGIKS